MLESIIRNGSMCSDPLNPFQSIQHGLKSQASSLSLLID